MVDAVDLKSHRCEPERRLWRSQARAQQVQRSVRDDGVHAEDIHRAPQTLATSAAVRRPLYKASGGWYFKVKYTPAGVMKW